MAVIPPPPVSGGDTPDQYTRASPDYSGDDPAENRVLHIRTKFFRYGINDKTQAAAIVLSFVLLLSALIVAGIATLQSFAGHEAKWVDTLVTWIGNAFLFTAGVALGKSGNGSGGNKKQD